MIPTEAPERATAAPRRAQIACGVVAVVVPPQWQATEIPYGMQVRLLITPPRRAEAGLEPLEGVWITYHSRTVADQDSYERLQQLCAETLRHAAGPGTVLTPPQPLLVDSWPGTRIDFQLPAAGPQSLGLRGFRAMIQTTSGICEVHAMAPAAAYPQRAADFEQLLAGIRLRPVASEERVATTIQAAASILGPWTATDRHLWLDAIGQITLEYEATAQDATGPGPGDRQSRAARTGRFEATADALSVEWNDGTRASYGWTVRDGRLLLTDPEGRTTTLNRWLNARR